MPLEAAGMLSESCRRSRLFAMTADLRFKAAHAVLQGHCPRINCCAYIRAEVVQVRNALVAIILDR
jgi:hypothetical protein